MKCFDRRIKDYITTTLPDTIDALQFAYLPIRFTDDAIAITLHTVLPHLDKRNTYVRMLFIAHPIASVVTNQEMSQSFHLFKGCRQGCPISPALFAIAMEPLGTLIRTNIALVKIKDTQHKMSIFAVNVILFLS
jgi:hypothetical protein